MDSQFDNEVDYDNGFDADNVIINGFSFCNRHSLEVCEKCPTDNRWLNNEKIENVLQENLSEAELKTKWKGDDREPFEVTHKWTRVSNKPVCSEHKEIGCNDCFNWGEMALVSVQGKKRAKKAAASRRKSKGSKDHTVDVAIKAGKA